MASKTDQLIRFFKAQGAVVRFAALLKAGFHSDTLAALEKQGAVEKVSRGLYKLSTSSVSSHPDLVSACLQAPQGVVCLLSALSFYEVTSEIPRQVEMAIPRGVRVRKIQYPPVKQYQFSQEAWAAGIEERKIEGHSIRVYDLAKTVVDCFKFRNKVGADVAREALKIAVIEKHVPPKDIMHYAKICRVANIIQPILEAII
ncbi:MAG: type IV toxin-antitoxin system AbiEi family antitoxin domain-containing protein [Candidatus Omnitrophica bacterium]|nr:type IV toxin-antitoxin system AbiEi family antitoxin domain-containing protein [Candidatus Omnitrophota bacterium]